MYCILSNVFSLILSSYYYSFFLLKFRTLGEVILLEMFQLIFIKASIRLNPGAGCEQGNQHGGLDRGLKANKAVGKVSRK